ncbi:hypothetical protein CN391_24895 [Bacillus anthracis]|nr:hypothetical protein CN391_24895 [Bacillus anthracis]
MEFDIQIYNARSLMLWRNHQKEGCVICKKKDLNEFSLRNVYDSLNLNKYLSFLTEEWIVADFIFNKKLDPYFEYAIRFLGKGDDVSIQDIQYLKCPIACKECIEIKITTLEQKFNHAFINMNKVKTYSVQENIELNFDGDVNQNILSYRINGDKTMTMNKMKFDATWLGYDVVYNITFDNNRGTAIGVFAKVVN